MAVQNAESGVVFTPAEISLQRQQLRVVNTHLLVRLPRSTQPCIPPGSLNRVPASAGVKAGMSPLPGGR